MSPSTQALAGLLRETLLQGGRGQRSTVRLWKKQEKGHEDVFAGLSQPMLSRFLTGRLIPNHGTMERLTMRLGRVSVDWRSLLMDVWATTVAECAYERLAEGGSSRYLLHVFDSHFARQLLRRRVEHASATTQVDILHHVESSLKARHVRRRLNEPGVWRVVNESLAVLRHGRLPKSVDRDLLYDLLRFCYDLQDGRRLVFPLTANLAFSGQERAGSLLMDQLRRSTRLGDELATNILLYYKTPHTARSEIGALLEMPPSHFANSYRDVLLLAVNLPKLSVA